MLPGNIGLLSRVRFPPSGTAPGNVDGPASSTNNALVLFNGTTGKIIKDSVDLTYVSPTLSVPDAFVVSSAGSIGLTAGGSNKSINLLPSGTGNVGIGVVNTGGGSGGSMLGVLMPGSTTPNFTTWSSGRIASFYSDGSNEIDMNTASASSNPFWGFKRSRGTLASPSAAVSEDIIGTIDAFAYDGSSFVESAYIQMGVDNTVGTGFAPGQISFTTANSAGTGAVRFKLGSEGTATFTGGQPVSVATTPGTASGNVFTFNIPTGGNTTISTTGIGGTGGQVIWTGGNGGTAASATTSSTGGNGGLWRLVGGNGGAAAVAGSGTNTGGTGGETRLNSGTGGAASTGTGVNVGGAGGPWNATTGNGGAATSGSSNTGGAGGSITMTTGNGGAGATAAGNSGTITLNTGTSGTGGTVGSVILKVGGTAGLTLSPTTTTLVGQGGNMTITAGTGASRTMALQTTTSGSAATTFLSGDASQNTTISKLITSYNGIATAGMGVGVVVAAPRQTAVTNAIATLATYTVPAADSTYRISANVLVTAATAAAMTVVCTYTDEGNTSRAQTIPFVQLAGTFLTSITNVTGVGPYEGATLQIRCKASTTIVFTTTGTVTGITYNVEGSVLQIA